MRRSSLMIYEASVGVSGINFVSGEGRTTLSEEFGEHVRVRAAQWSKTGEDSKMKLFKSRLLFSEVH